MAKKNNWHRVGIVLVVCALYFALAGRSMAINAKKTQVNFYVSTTGSDNNPGSIDKPFATLGKARDAIRKLQSSSIFKYMFSPEDAGEPIRVTVRGGTYYLSSPLTLGSEDSGTKDHPIVYMAYPDEKVTISGGRRITGWKRTEGKLWRADVKDRPPFRQLFVNDRRARVTRLPARGYFNLVDVLNPEDRKDPVNRTGFKFKPGDLKKDWTNLSNVEIVKLYSWSAMRMPIAAIDEENNIVKFTGLSEGNERIPDWAGTRYYIENVFEGLDSPGEWYLNRETSVLYYWPLPGEEMDKADVVAPVLGHLIELRGDVDGGKFVRNITFKGFTLSHNACILPKDGYCGGQSSMEITGPLEEKVAALKKASLPVDIEALGRPGGAISAVGAIGCAFRDNHITHIGTYAIDLGRGCKNNKVLRNRINDLGAGAVKIGMTVVPSRAEEASGNIVADNYIYDGGIIYLGANGIWIGNCGSNIISHNEVRDFNYTGIAVGFMWGCHSVNRGRNNIIEYNYIHHVARRVLNDGGGIYLLGNSPGTVLNNNLIHDVYTSGHLGRGIYLDQGGSFITIKNNIIYNTINITCVGQGDNIIKNNIFAGADTCQIWYSGGNEYGGCGKKSDKFLRNIVYYSHPNATYCKFYSIGDKAGMKKAVGKSDYNVLFHTAGKDLVIEGMPGVGTFAQWKENGYEAHSIVADPLFVDAANNNYNLKPNSPAFKLGFKAIDMSTVGPRK